VGAGLSNHFRRSGHMPRRRSRVTSRGWARRPQPFSLVALAGFGLAVAALVGLALAGLGSQWGWWHFRTGFSILRWAAYLGILAAVLSLVGLVRARPGRPRRGLTLAVLGVVIGALAFGIPWQWQRYARGKPPIHDITTDIQNPPEFRAVLPLRADAPNPPEYAGEEVAAQQRAAYPEIRPLRLESAPIVAFQRAVSAARSLRWEIVAVDEEAGILEATDRTFWFGFEDDIVVRVTPVGDGSRIDVRSKSRVGRGDAGANARRIHRFLERVQGR
jgi:uncharacterized protein (DUF1499 family)